MRPKAIANPEENPQKNTAGKSSQKLGCHATIKSKAPRQKNVIIIDLPGLGKVFTFLMTPKLAATTPSINTV